MVATRTRVSLTDSLARLDLPLLPTYSFNPRVSPTLAKLRKLPKPRYNPLWPEGTDNLSLKN